MVQDPDSAKYDGMPRSAIATGIVDFILPVEKLPAELIKYVKAPYVSQARQPSEPDESFSNHIQKVFSLIRTSTGHDLSHYKQTTIHRRIERRLAVHQIEKISRYVTYLQKTPSEVDILFKDMLIGVTNFFRDPNAFKVLKAKVIPALLKNRQPDSTIRVWVVGCSTGEEAYSISILFSEVMTTLKQHYNVQVFASDIDAQAIDHARSGIYPESIAADVSKARLNRFFIKEGDTFKVKKQIRESVIFAVQNVIKDPPFSKLDMVSCRNLLIYMDGILQKEVLPLCHYTLNPDGLLFLGPSESIGEFTDYFQPIDNKWKIFKRKEHFIERPVDYPSMPFYQGPKYVETERVIPTKEFDIQNMAERIILDQYSPPGVLVNESYEIVHFMGKTDKFLETPVGKASFNVLKMAREGLRFKLGTALHNAMRQKLGTTYEAIRIKYNGNFRIVDLTVRPLTEAKATGGFFLILFEERIRAEKSTAKKGAKEVVRDDSDPVVDSLERELESTKEHFQTTIEEMETSNEELKSTNEELQSVNEELQSTNEELETSKEELQSTNEELVTVNTELQNKVDELSQANNDINNLLASTDIGTIFLDPSLSIKRFTPAMTKIFNLIKTDIDRPISHITSRINYLHIKKDAERVLNTLIHKEVEVQSDMGEWYSMRISPYRTIENVIDGVVITFVDITSLKDMEKYKQETEAEHRLASIIKDSNDAITVQDFEGNVLAWNKGAVGMYGYSEAAALKMNIRDLVPEDKKTEALDFVKKLQEEEVTSFETQRKTKDGKILDIWLTVTLLVDDKGEPMAVASTERDVTEQRKSEANLRRLATVVMDSNDAITIQDFEGNISAWNKGAAKMYGYSEAEVLTMNIRDIVPDDKKSEALDYIRKMQEEEEVESFETQRITKDGKILDVWLTVTKIVDEEGKSVAVATTERDITDRK